MSKSLVRVVMVFTEKVRGGGFRSLEPGHLFGEGRQEAAAEAGIKNRAAWLRLFDTSPR
ncbi:MAG: hypothetical protein AB1801_05960 [Chloroflexota bacterium]